MYFSVIPFSHSIGVQPLLYSGGDIMDDQLQIGSLVEIPYGKNLENGIITDIYRDSPIHPESEEFLRIKTIERIISQKMILHPYQIRMICAISAKYMIPIHRVLGIFLTRPILSRLEKKNYEQLHNETKHTMDKNPQITKQHHGKLHIVQDTIVTPDLVNGYIDGHTVIVLPDDFAMIPYQEYHKNREDILFISTDMTDTKRAQAWIDISGGVFSIIYGTRKILYYNLSKYTNIIYIEDALGPDYWHYPIRIDYSDIIRIFIQTNPMILFTVLTSVPTLSTLIHFRNFEIKNI